MLDFVPDVLWLNAPLFILGLFIIIRGSDLFLDAAVWVARASGVPQVIIGATVVSLCTTLPELVSSCTASYRGAADMALGNAVGSVICNTGFIMGVMLLFITAVIRREIFLIKGIFMLGGLFCSLFLLFPVTPGGTGSMIRTEGLTLLVILAIYMVVNYYESLQVSTETGEIKEEGKPKKFPKEEWVKQLLVFLLGAVLVAGGAYLLVEFGQRLARNVGVSEAVISLIFVAFGTSLPELFTAISAVRKKAEQISIGNIFGANVLNMVLVIGASATIRELEVGDRFLISFDIPVAIVLCSLAFVSGLIRGRVGKATGATLLGLYVLYLLSMFFMGRMPTG